jgi:hypothetical protein
VRQPDRLLQPDQRVDGLVTEVVGIDVGRAACKARLSRRPGRKEAAQRVPHKPAFGDRDEFRGHGEVMMADVLAISDPIPVFPIGQRQTGQRIARMGRYRRGQGLSSVLKDHQADTCVRRVSALRDQARPRGTKTTKIFPLICVILPLSPGRPCAPP